MTGGWAIIGFSVSLGVLYPSRVTSDSSAMTSAVLREKEKERKEEIEK